MIISLQKEKEVPEIQNIGNTAGVPNYWEHRIYLAMGFVESEVKWKPMWKYRGVFFRGKLILKPKTDFFSFLGKSKNGS